MMRSTWLAALAWAMFVITWITQMRTGVTLSVVDATAIAVFVMAWAVYLRIGESR